MTTEETTMNQTDPSFVSLVAMVSDLRHELTTLRQDNEDLRDELARVHHSPPSNPTSTTTDSVPLTVPPSTHTNAKQPKMVIPDPFDGNRSDLKRFGAQCVLYMAVRSNDFPDDLSRIAFALSLMKGGTAAPWAMRVIKTLSHDLTWAQFERDLHTTFGEANPGATARAKLESLRMGTNTADEYVQQFETLADESELDEVALIHVFERGLHRSVTEKIYGLEVMPKTLKSWKEYASRFDNQYRRFRALTKDPPNPRYPPRTTTNTNTIPVRTNAATAASTTTQTRLPTTLGPGPMDIDRARARRREDFMKKGLCFRCGQGGHVAKDCPQARPMIRAVDVEADENSVAAFEEGKTPTVDVEAVVRAVLAETKKTSAKAERKDF